ncbi:MAG: hypothetical protein SNJ73_09590 [Acetobacteraceae bacterium]
MGAAPPRRWLQPDGAPVSCREKIKVLEENWQELAETLRDAYEDAVLMGVDPAEMKRLLAELIEGLTAPGPGAR